MKILVIGGGGREHALVWKIASSPLVKQVFCAPGNAGISQMARCVPIAATELDKLAQFAEAESIDLTVVGPEQPLVEGIVDLFQHRGLKVFGPDRRAALLEGSKVFSKNLLVKYHIPTAHFSVFGDPGEAAAYIEKQPTPLVVKADGLAAGKGVLICPTKREALSAIDQIMEKKNFGPAGDRIVVEEFLTGEEVSILALSDGEHLITLSPAQDHKRIGDGDRGANTGGMGAYAPTPFLDSEKMENIRQQILLPTIRAMAAEERPYKGVLYAGLILTADGPKVLEFNCRFGDPETQVILPLLEGDLVEAMLASLDGTLERIHCPTRPGFAIGVVMASQGYPDKYETGEPITGLEDAARDDILVFHSGSRFKDGRIVTAGGRVLTVTALGETLPAAIDSAYQQVSRIHFQGAYFRHDIGAKGLR